MCGVRLGGESCVGSIHINGDAAYSARENLRLICPNCDSQLDTFKSKNKNSARTKRKEFLREIREEDK